MDALQEVRFIKAIRVAADGIHAESVVEGQMFSLPPALAAALIRDKYAVASDTKVVTNIPTIAKVIDIDDATLAVAQFKEDEKDTPPTVIVVKPIAKVQPSQFRRSDNRYQGKHRR